MRYKKIMILTIILTCLLAVSAVSAAENVTDDIVGIDNAINEISTVDNSMGDAVSVVDNETDDIISADASDDVVSVEETTDKVVSVENNNQTIDLATDGSDYLSDNSVGTFTDLVNEIANASGELKLSRNYVYDPSIDSRYSGGITISKQITINGRGFTIDGGNKVSSFSVSSNNVILKNVEFINCLHGFWTGNNGRLYDSNFINCRGAIGGAIWWNGNNGSLYDSNFINCCGDTGGALYWTGDNTNIFNCNFENCYSSSSKSDSTSKYGTGERVSSGSSSSSGYGGAIYIKGNNNNLFNCSFRDCYNSHYNYHNHYGYGAYTPDFQATGSSSSSSYGGAVYWQGSNGNLFDCDFINCYSYSNSSCDVTNGYSHKTMSSYSCSYSYGAVYWQGDDGTLFDCDFLNALYGFSYGSGSRSYAGSPGYVTSSSSSSSYGGAVYWNGTAGNLFDCDFINSHTYSSSDFSSAFGGAVFWFGTNGDLLNCSFINCGVHNIGYGEVIYWQGTKGDLLNCIFNSTDSDGKHVYWQGTEGEMFNCSFNGNPYDYEKYCIKSGAATVYPIILIHSSTLDNDERIVIFESTQLVNNISAQVYNVTDRKILCAEFNISSEELTSSLNLNNLGEGEYQIVLQYAGDSFYTSTSANNLFKIGKNSSYDVTITDNLIAGDNATINVTLNGDATGRVKITLENYTFIEELVDGKTSFNISNVKGGINTYKIKYEGDDKYNPIYITDTFIVLYKSNLKLNLKENSIYGEEIPLTYTIAPNCIGNISIFVDNVFKTNISVGNSFELENIDAGEHNITVIYNGNEYFSKSSDSTTLIISKADPTIKFNSSKLPGDVSFEISLNETATGNVTLILEGINSYPGNLTNGKTNIIVPNLNAGDYSVKIIYNGCKNYNNKTYTTTLTIDKISTTVIGTVDDITYTENAIINVKGSVDGIAIVKIDESYIKNINIIANTIAPATFENIPVGKHNVTITLKPTNTNYNESKYSTEFTVSQKETTVNLNVIDSVYGEDVIVNVTASEDGKVILKVGSIIREKNVLANTLTKFNFGVLAANSYNVELNFNAGENYKQSTKNDNIIISPAKAEILILQAENNVYGENTIIKVKTNVEGTLTFNVGSITRSFDIVANKLTSFNFGILDAKTYAVEVSLDAGNNYTKPTNTTQVTIESKQTTVNVNVKNSTYGNVIVNVTASENGEISVNIGDTTKYVNVEANKVYPVDFSVLNANSYNVYVTFDGGNNYKKSYNNAFLIVSPAKSEITQIQVPNNVYGENTIIKVKANVDGVLTAKINTITKEVNLNANQITSIDFGILNANNYEVELSFNAGNNYIPTTATKTFKVLKTDPTISIGVTNATYGQAATIIVNSNAEGNATIEIGSVKTYNNILFKNNRIIQDVTGIDAGFYSVKVTYNGNNNYNAKTYVAKLTINKASTTVVGTVEDIDYTQNAIINVKGSVDGIAVVKIDESFIKNVNVLANTVASVTFENIPAGKHNVTLTLKPTNTNYDESTYNTEFTVSKKEASVSLNVVDSIYGKDVIVNVTAGEDGKVILKVGDITQEKNILANTPTKFNLGVLAVSSYAVEVSLDAGENYNIANKQSTFDVTPAKAEITTIQVQDNIYDENTVINVKTNVSGVLTVKLNNNEKIFNIDANKLTSLDLDKYDVGTYNIDLSLDAGVNYTKATITTKVTIAPKQTTTNVNAGNSVYGNNVIVKVTASENGRVTVQIGNIVKSVNVDANKVASVDFGILDVNSYEVSATFDGGKNFNTSSDKTTLAISPKASSVTIVDLDNQYIYSKNVVINVKSDATGTLTVKLGDKTQTKQVIAEHIVSFDFGVFDVNKYDVKISLDAGNNYIPSQNTASIIINPKSTVVTLNTKEYGADEKVIVNITASEKGIVTIKLGNIVKTVNVNANVLTSVDLGIFDTGSYVVTANFTAGNNYIDSSNSNTIKVLSKIKQEEINITIPEIKANEENNIVINLPSDATGTVTLIIGNSSYAFDVKNGVANINVPKLDDGNYNYVINYSGDNKYASFENIGSIDVAKPTPEIVVPPLDKPSADGSVAIKLPSDAGGTITLVIDKKPYSFPVVNGVANIYMPDLANGNYDYTITYSGDGKYSSFTKTANITVNNIVPTIISASKVGTAFNGGKYITAILKDSNGNPLKDVNVTVKFSNGKTAIATTDKNGQVKVSTDKLAPVKKYTATITFAGNSKYAKSTKTVNVYVVKANLKVTPTLKKYKANIKYKKYYVTVKNSKNQKLKNIKVSLTVKGRTFSTYTLKNGVATLKVTNLLKKGTYKAYVSFAGSKYYNKLSKKVYITVK